MRHKSTAERFWAKVDICEWDSHSCWVWTGAHMNKGYGTFSIDGRNVRVHRWVYEQLVGLIPTGLVLDHLCRRRDCVNPAHLEPVTNAENVRRGEPAQRTHCPKGHPYAGSNLLIKKRVDGRTYRACRVCYHGGTL